MRLVSLTCNQCGAPLEVPEKVQFVTCAYCSARLTIHHSGNAVYSESLDEIEKRTAEIADDLETIKLQNELESLDRQWMLDRERYKVKGEDGHYSVPGQAGSIVAMVVAAGFGLFWTVGAASMGAPFFSRCLVLFS
jgi:DNA-directed RNA polymerase subunit RPC12/RpoP